MRIGVDYSAAVWQGAGIGRYSRALIRALLEVDQENDYVLFFPRGLPSRPAPFLEHLYHLRQSYPRIQLRSIPLSDYWTAVLWHRLRLPVPIEALCGPLDLFYSPDFVLPPQIAGRRTLTTHDLAFLRYPECAVPNLGWYYRAVSRSIHRADLIMADSENTRQDLIRILEVNPDQVEVLYSGVDPAFRPIQERAPLEAVRARYNLPDRFLLSVGTVEPRKNLVRLFEALAALPHELRLPLFVVGQSGWLYEDTFSSVNRLGLHQWVHFLGFVPEEILPALYNLALALIYPSLYEGFGLPPLEAMACGTPILTSHTSSMPEVVGEAAILVDPLDVTSIRNGLGRLLEDESLRAQLRQAGLQRAQQFTWQNAAHRLLQLLQRPLATIE